MFDIVYTDGKYWAISQDESKSYGPYDYAAEAAEKADELNETNNNDIKGHEVRATKSVNNVSRS